MNFTSCTHLSVPLYLPSSLATSLWGKEKEKKKKKGIKMCLRGSCSVSWCVTQYAPSHKQLDSANVPGRLSLVWSLASAVLSVLDPLGPPVVALCHGAPEALPLQSRPLRVPQQFTDGSGQLGSWPGWQSTSSPASTPSRPALQHCPTAHPMLQLARGVASYPALTSLRPARPHPCHQGPLYCAVQVRCRAPLSFSGLVI